MLLEIGSFLFGDTISSQLKVCCKVIIEGGQVEASKDSKNDGPQICRLFESACEELLHSEGKVKVGFVNEKFVKGIEIFEFNLPEINVVDGCVFFEAVNKSMISEQVLSVFDVLGDELSNVVETS